MKVIHSLVISTLIVRLGTCQVPTKAEVVLLNGNQIYYEVYGEGKPLFLLHTFTLSSKSWRPFVSEYAKQYKVYLVDLQGHGKSGSYKQKLSIRSAAEDVNNLIKFLHLDSIRAIGFSYGGDVLYQLNLIDPHIIKSMITIGACGTWDAQKYPDLLAELSYDNIENLKWMRDHHQDESQIRKILEQLPNYNISMSKDEIKRIKAKTLIVLGDRDTSVGLDCISVLREHLPESYLWIIPNAGHAAHQENAVDFVKVSRSFFEKGFNPVN